jgi:pilus retraction protein PilT
MDITQLLAFSVKNKASDLHLSSGLPPMIRVHGDVRRINVDPLEHKAVHDMVYDIMNDSQRKHYEDTLECDFSFEIQGLARFRVNAFNQNRGAAAVFRTIPSKILTLEQLNTPKIFAELSLKPRGLVLVTGPTGSGKSTTLAAMVNHLNENEYAHVLTVEDPIEFVHESKKCLVNQRSRAAHAELCQRAALGVARRPRRDPGGRNARPGDHPPGADRGGNRPPGVRHAAHELRRQDDRLRGRRVPAAEKRWCARCCRSRWSP